MKKAYLVWELEVHDEDTYAKYRDIGGPLMSQAGGRTVAGTGRRQTLVGNQTPAGIFLVEFPNYEDALAWWNSPEYQRAAGIRDSASTSRTYILEGV